MKISEMIKSLQFELETYGDVDVAIHTEKDLSLDNIFFDMSIGDQMCSEDMKEKKQVDKLWIQNYPY